MARTIPLIDAREGGVIATLQASPERAAALVAMASRAYTPVGLAIADRISEAWLQRSGNRYRDRIAAIAERIGRRGGSLLNLSYEWGCTSAVAPDPSGIGNRLLRTLDWPLHGLGENIVVAHERGSCGEFYNVTWPGAVAVLTAMAPGRFSVSLNQAPMIRHGWGIAIDWLINRVGIWNSRELPPTHLLRHVVETAPDFATARDMLRDTRLTAPCFYIVSGVRAEDGCVIERLEDRAFVHDGRAVCANAWITPTLTGRPRGRDNAERRSNLMEKTAQPATGFEWMTPPVLNPDTRVAVSANAAKGQLRVLGVEASQPATEEFFLDLKLLE